MNKIRAAVVGVGYLGRFHAQKYAQLAECGTPLLYCHQAIEAVTPSADECKIFGFTEPVPCLLIKRRSFGHGEQVLEYVEGLFRGDLYTYRLKLTV